MKKALRIVGNIITWIFVIFAVCMMIFTVVSVTLFDSADRNLFGYHFSIVLSDSMSATDFSAGDLVITQEVDPSTLKEGDIISFQSTNTENYGEVVTHKIRKLTTDASGAPGFVTYGTTTDTDDENIVTYEFVIGKYVTSIPGVGTFLQFIKSTPGYIICIFLPFLLLILIQGVKSIRLFRKYKRQQLEEMQAEREKQQAEIQSEREQLAIEREQSRLMMEQLKQMQAQFGTVPKQEAPTVEPQPQSDDTAEQISEQTESV